MQAFGLPLHLCILSIIVLHVPKYMTFRSYISLSSVRCQLQIAGPFDPVSARRLAASETNPLHAPGTGGRWIDGNFLFPLAMQVGCSGSDMLCECFSKWEHGSPDSVDPNLTKLAAWMFICRVEVDLYSWRKLHAWGYFYPYHNQISVCICMMQRWLFPL